MEGPRLRQHQLRQLHRHHHLCTGWGGSPTPATTVHAACCPSDQELQIFSGKIFRSLRSNMKFFQSSCLLGVFHSPGLQQALPLGSQQLLLSCSLLTISLQGRSALLQRFHLLMQKSLGNKSPGVRFYETCLCLRNIIPFWTPYGGPPMLHKAVANTFFSQA